MPANIIKMRFHDEIVSDLLEIGWWNYKPDILSEIDITDSGEFVGRLMERVEKYKENHWLYRSEHFIFDSDTNRILRKNLDHTFTVLG